MDIELFKEKQRKILENITYAKERNINKVTAIIVEEDEEIEKQLLFWLIYEGYRVSLIRDDVNIISIEW
ncbi:MAG: hypothetical protein E7212_13725 [Clostridium sartagoforme]|nr:hypothetical protein [Clostridium sartagoforme]